MSNAQTAVEVTPPLVAGSDSILERIGHRDVEVIQAEVGIPTHLQYGIKGGRKEVDGVWKDVQKVGLTSDGYDHINRVVGCQIVAPRFVHDDNGREVLNPIHRRDYIYLRLVGIWWNDLGQMLAYSEDLEVDFMLMYQEARLNASWYEDVLDAEGKPVWENKNGRDRKKQTGPHKAQLELAKDKNGQPIYNPDGTPVHRLILPESEELKALQRLYNLRNMGLRYAWTVAKTRILKVATGIRTLPIDSPRPVKVKVYGFRDGLTPQQREERAKHDQEQIFGKALAKGDTLTDAELAEADLPADSMEEEAAVIEPAEGQQQAFTVDEVDEVIAGATKG